MRLSYPILVFLAFLSPCRTFLKRAVVDNNFRTLQTMLTLRGGNRAIHAVHNTSTQPVTKETSSCDFESGLGTISSSSSEVNDGSILGSSDEFSESDYRSKGTILAGAGQLHPNTYPSPNASATKFLGFKTIVGCFQARTHLPIHLQQDN